MKYYQISAEDLGKESKIPIIKLGDSAEVFYEMALIMVDQIKKNNMEGKKTVFICPVGPVGQYPIFVRLVNSQRISLKNVWFFNMDEYLDENMNWIEKENKLSFRGFMDQNVYSKIDPGLIMPESQRVFPDPKNPSHVPELINKLGGVDICFGGIGINGHLAFNEADDSLTAEEFAKLPTRVLEISRETRATNSIGDLGGAIDAMPKHCITIGINEILSAKRLVFGVFRDWHRAVIRQAAYGEVSAHFPATLMQNHKNAVILVNQNAAQQPF